MTNLVNITIKATDSTSDAFTKVKLEAAKAGAEAAKAFNDAFKIHGGGSVTTKDKLEATGAISGDDKQLLNKLKSYANTPGGIGILGTGNDTSLMSMLKNQIRSAGENGGLSLVGGTQSTSDMVKQVLTGSGPSNVTTSDIIKQVLEGVGPGNVSTEDLIKQVVTGNTPGNIETKDIIHPTVDDADIKALGEKDGNTYGTSFASKVKDALSGVFGSGGGGSSGIGTLLAGAGGSADPLNAGGIAGGALPGIPGVSGLAATITGLAAAVVAVLPAITAVAGGLAVIGGAFAGLILTSAKFKTAMTGDLSDLEKEFGQIVAPLAKPFEQAVSNIVGYFKQIQPDLSQLFAASVPLLNEFVKGFEELLSGAGPGFLMMIKASEPAFATLASAFADLGKSLGEMFTDFAQAAGPSAVVLKGFLDIINSLLPFLGMLGKEFASALAPAFISFSAALAKVLPALAPLGKIIGDLAGAALSDLASVLGAVGQLLIGMAPSFLTLTKVAGNLFSVLENNGVFASLGNVLEGLALPLAKVINALVEGLAPILPQVLTAVSAVSGAITSALINALVSLLPDVTIFVQLLGQLIAASVPLIPSLLQLNLALVQMLIALTPILPPVLKLIDLFVQLAVQVITPLIPIINQSIDALTRMTGTISTVIGWIARIVTAGLNWVDNLLSVQSSVNQFINKVLGWFGQLPAQIEGYFKTAASWLVDGGKNILTGLWNGLKDIWSDVTGWFEGLSKDILKALGIASPPAWAIQAGKDIAQGLGIGVSNGQHHVTTAMKNLKSVAAAAGPGAVSGSIQALMQSMAAAKGWTGAQWNALYDVEMREAGFNTAAKNPGSGAYGLAQFINGPSEYAQYGGNSSTAAGQITGMLNYIAQRYGTPAAAWQHELDYGWYDKGGWLPTGASIAINNTGSPEQILGPGQSAGGGVNISFEVGSSGNVGFDNFMLNWLRSNVRIKGGGNVQRAFGNGNA